MDSLLLFSPYIIRRLFGHKWTIKPGKVQNRKLSGSELLKATGFLDINGQIKSGKVQNRKRSGSELLKAAGFLDINGQSSWEKSKIGSDQAVNS